MTGWRSPPPDVEQVAGVHPMPCPDPSSTSTSSSRPRKGNPGCQACLPLEPCRRHSYAVLASVAGARRLTREERLSATFYAVC